MKRIALRMTVRCLCTLDNTTTTLGSTNTEKEWRVTQFKWVQSSQASTGRRVKFSSAVPMFLAWSSRRTTSLQDSVCIIVESSSLRIGDQIWQRPRLDNLYRSAPRSCSFTTRKHWIRFNSQLSLIRMAWKLASQRSSSSPSSTHFSPRELTTGSDR